MSNYTHTRCTICTCIYVYIYIYIYTYIHVCIYTCCVWLCILFTCKHIYILCMYVYIDISIHRLTRLQVQNVLDQVSATSIRHSLKISLLFSTITHLNTHRNAQCSTAIRDSKNPPRISVFARCTRHILVSNRCAQLQR